MKSVIHRIIAEESDCRTPPRNILLTLSGSQMLKAGVRTREGNSDHGQPMDTLVSSFNRNHSLASLFVVFVSFVVKATAESRLHGVFAPVAPAAAVERRPPHREAREDSAEGSRATGGAWAGREAAAQVHALTGAATKREPEHHVGCLMP